MKAKWFFILPVMVHMVCASCNCPPTIGRGFDAFVEKFNAAYSVVEGYVSRVEMNCTLCEPKWEEHSQSWIVSFEFATMYYSIYSIRKYKDALPNGRPANFKIQTMYKKKYCGVKFELGEHYIFNFQDYRRISRASHMRNDRFWVDKCQGHKKRNKLTPKERSFLNGIESDAWE